MIRLQPTQKWKQKDPEEEELERVRKNSVCVENDLPPRCSQKALPNKVRITSFGPQGDWNVSDDFGGFVQKSIEIRKGADSRLS